MRSDRRYSTTQAYIGATTEFAELYDGAFMQMFGRGEATVGGDDAAGGIGWTNFPRRRPDGGYLPDITGVIKLDGAERPIMYRMTGISLLPNEHDRRLFAGPVL
jgi:hypothetical protein